jgi:hypothetical protein
MDMMILKIILIVIVGAIALLIFGSCCGRFIKGVSIKLIDEEGKIVYDSEYDYMNSRETEYENQKEKEGDYNEQPNL